MIQTRKISVPVQRCCQLLEVPRSEVYRPRVERKPDALIPLVCQAVQERRAYGYRRIAAHLRRQGESQASLKRVRTLMHRLGLGCKLQRRWTRTTIAGKGPAAPNLAKGLVLTGPGQLLLTDLTYVALPGCFGYVSVVLDAYTRKALGWAAATSMSLELPKAALAIALSQVELAPDWIHHSDRGSQYTSSEYQNLVQSQGGTLSNSRPGNPYDNAIMESFFKTYKHEEANLNDYDTLEEIQKSLDLFLDDYNSNRLHSSLGYRSPNEYENLHAEQTSVCVR